MTLATHNHNLFTHFAPIDAPVAHSSLRSHAVLRGILRLTDMFLVASCGVAGWLLGVWTGAPPLPALSAGFACVIGAMLFILCMGVQAGYRMDMIGQGRAQLSQVFIALSITIAIMMAASTLAGQHEHGFRLWLGQWYAGGLAVLGLQRLGVATIYEKARRQGILARRVAILGASEQAASLLRRLNAQNPDGFYRLVGIFDDRRARVPPQIEGVPVIGGVDDLIAAVRAGQIDATILTIPWKEGERWTELLRKLEAHAIDVYLASDLPRIARGRRRPAWRTDLSAWQIAEPPMRDWDRILKKLEDMVIASVGLVLLSPILLLAAIAIKLDSKGPVFFVQQRWGFNNRTFGCLKLRTMRVDAPDQQGAQGTLRDDDRITRVGRFLRKTSIDEFPQLVNVLRGEMSIVGPRAHAVGMKVGEQIYMDTVKAYASRHRVKPGITGWAQINGMRGGIHTPEKAERSVTLDITYIENWSIWFDMKIILRTAFGGMSGKDVF